jgi:hypothetical protein
MNPPRFLAVAEQLDREAEALRVVGQSLTKR